MPKHIENEIAGWLDAGTRQFETARQLAAGTEADRLIQTLIQSAAILADRIRRDLTLTQTPKE